MMVNKIAIVTGGSSGIGQSITKKLSKKNYNIYVLDLQKLSKKNSNSVFYIQCDISDLNQAKSSINLVIEREKRIDVLINCAGIYPIVNLENYSLELWQKCLAVNLTAPFNLIKLVSPMMITQRKGYIVNVTSGAVKLGSRDPGYTASKSALEGLTKSCAKNLAKYNILVNAVAPGPIETKMSDRMNKVEKEKYSEMILLNRFGKPEEVAQVIWFLISGNADYLTGTTIHINGGLYC